MDLSKFNQFINKTPKYRKTDKEIIEYLEPYTKMEGIHYHTLVVYGFDVDNLNIEIDLKRGFKDCGGSSKIKSLLRRQGFKNDMGVWKREKDKEILICPVCGEKYKSSHTGNFNQHIKFKHPDFKLD